MDFEFAGRTDRGKVRDRNEDALLMRPDRGLFAVADGMGGHAAGDVASRIAVDVLDDRTAGHLDDAAPPIDGPFLADSIAAAHDAILRAAGADPDLEGMGTTLTVLRVDAAASGCVIAHVGDSRAYRLRDGRLQQVTRDQTWVQEQVDAGAMTAERARKHPFSAMLTCALGVADAELDVQTYDEPCRPGDLLLLCSDGLNARLSDDDIADILRGDDPSPDLDDLAAALIDAANDAGGPDNITVALVRVG